jgi:hypothetical protein
MSEAVLLRVCAGPRQLVTRLRVHRSSLDTRFAFVLDDVSSNTVFTWTGTLAAKTTAATRAVYMALQIKARKGAGAAVVTAAQGEESAAFWRAIDEHSEAAPQGGGSGASTTGVTGDALSLSIDASSDVAFFPHILFKVLGGRVEICGKGDTLHRKQLTSSAAFVLDTLSAVFCWLGADCVDKDAAVARGRAAELSKKTMRPPIFEIDGDESPLFQAQLLGFDDEKVLREAKKVALGKLNLANISPRTLAPLLSPTAKGRPSSLPSSLSSEALRRQLEMDLASARGSPPATPIAISARDRNSATAAPLTPTAADSPALSPRRRRRANHATLGSSGSDVAAAKQRHRRSRTARPTTVSALGASPSKASQVTAASVFAPAADATTTTSSSSATMRRHRERAHEKDKPKRTAPPAVPQLSTPSSSLGGLAKTFAVLRSPRTRRADSDSDADNDDNNNNNNDDDGGGRGAGDKSKHEKAVVDALVVDADADVNDRQAALAATSGAAAVARVASPRGPLLTDRDGSINAAVNLQTRDLREDVGILRQQITQIESHIAWLKLGGRSNSASQTPATAGAASAAAPDAAPPPTLPVPNGSVIVRGGNRVVGAAPSPAAPAPTPAFLSATAPTVPPLPPQIGIWHPVSSGNEPFSLTAEYRVRVAVAACDGGDSVMYATRVDASMLHFGLDGVVSATAKSVFRRTTSADKPADAAAAAAADLVVVWLQCRDPIVAVSPRSNPLSRASSKSSGLTHGVVSQATNVFLSRATSPTGSPRLQLVDTARSIMPSGLSRAESPSK